MDGLVNPGVRCGRQSLSRVEPGDYRDRKIVRELNFEPLREPKTLNRWLMSLPILHVKVKLRE
jgi:hypothetical protein